MTMAEIHNKSFCRAARAIINPTMKDGGETSDVMLVLESTIAAVLLSTHGGNPFRASATLEERLIPGVIDRLVKFAKDQGTL